MYLRVTYSARLKELYGFAALSDVYVARTTLNEIKPRSLLSSSGVVVTGGPHTHPLSFSPLSLRAYATAGAAQAPFLADFHFARERLLPLDLPRSSQSLQRVILRQDCL